MTRKPQLLTVFLFASLASLAGAEEPAMEADANFAWWSNPFSTNPLNTPFDAGSESVEPEFWWRRKWGIKGSVFNSDAVEPNSAEGPDYLRVDIKRKLFSATGDKFLALGLGWESISVRNGANIRGPRLLLEGRAGLTPILSLYGHTAWLPTLEESSNFEDPDGIEFEAGFAVKPLPRLSLRAGYREIRLDFKSLQGVNETTKSKVVVLGAGVHW